MWGFEVPMMLKKKKLQVHDENDPKELNIKLIEKDKCINMKSQRQEW